MRENKILLITRKSAKVEILTEVKVSGSLGERLTMW